MKGKSSWLGGLGSEEFEGKVVKVLVASREGRAYAVQGYCEGEACRLLLVGGGRKKGSESREEVEKGGVVRLARPVWELDLVGEEDREKWIVAVEWEVLGV